MTPFPHAWNWYPTEKTPRDPGTFMIVVTPAAPLKRIAEGIDWTFVPDVSGSMAGQKITTLANGVSQVLGKDAGSGNGGMFQGQRAPSVGIGPVGHLMDGLAAVLARMKRRMGKRQ
jgi:hypothetical protein